MTTSPEALREAVERVEAWARIIERPAPDGDNSLKVAASVAEQHAQDLRTLLSTLQEAREALVPEGWALVPIEPTDEMVDAADVPFHAEWRAQRESSVRLYGKEAYASDPFSRATWKAMLSAAEVYRALSSDPEQPK